MKNTRPEAKLWRSLRPKLQQVPDLDFDRIETGSTSKNVPDVAYTRHGHHGWIELKAVEPRDGYVNIKHFTAGQRRFLVERGRKAGHCFLLVRAGAKCFLIPWYSLQHLPASRCSIDTLERLAEAVEVGVLSVHDLKEYL